MAAGLLISLLSKPILLLLLPLLLLLKETRRAACAALLVYVGISAAFLQIPTLNPRGDNWIHWSNIWTASGAILYAAAPNHVSFIIPDIAKDLCSLAGLLHDWFPGRVPAYAYHLPLIAVLAFAVLAARSRDAAQRTTLTLVAAILGIEAYYLSYTIVWEYHYTTLLPAIPVLWCLYRAAHGPRRFAAALAFWSSACVLLPTLYFLFPADAESHQALGKLVRVVPTAVAFVSLAVYGAIVAMGPGKWGRSHQKLPVRFSPQPKEGIGDWGLGFGFAPPRLIPNPQSLIPLSAAAAWLAPSCSGRRLARQSRQRLHHGRPGVAVPQAAEVLPQRRQSWVFWAKALINADGTTKPHALLETSLRRSPDFGPTHQLLAQVLQTRGDLPRAAAELRMALRLDSQARKSPDTTPIWAPILWSKATWQGPGPKTSKHCG